MIGFKMAVDGILRGAGAVKVFAIANLVNLGLRVLIAKFGAPVYGIAMAWYAVPLGWLANFLISYQPSGLSLQAAAHKRCRKFFTVFRILCLSRRALFFIIRSNLLLRELSQALGAV